MNMNTSVCPQLVSWTPWRLWDSRRTVMEYVMNSVSSIKKLSTAGRSEPLFSYSINPPFYSIYTISISNQLIASLFFVLNVIK